MVESGAGFRVMPRVAVEPLSAGLEVTPLPVTVHRQITLCALPSVASSQAGGLLLRQIRSSVQRRFRSDGDASGSERRYGVTCLLTKWGAATGSDSTGRRAGMMP